MDFLWSQYLDRIFRYLSKYTSHFSRHFVSYLSWLLLMQFCHSCSKNRVVVSQKPLRWLDGGWWPLVFINPSIGEIN